MSDERTVKVRIAECQTTGCKCPPMYRFTWPGAEERGACFLCAAKLTSIAKALGFHLQMVPLPAPPAEVEGKVEE